MSWITTTLGSSTGKKPIMAISGIGFCSFLAAHLVGNLTIYWGKESFNNYAEHLHSLGPLITISELGLLFFGLIHIIIAGTLFFENRSARPVKYTIKSKAGGRTLGSSTMPYTGMLLLVFLFVHLINFHFVDKTNTSTFNVVHAAFSNIGYVCFYILSALATAIHVSHGFWSAFQTIGINHEKYTTFIKLTGSIFSLIIGIGFGFMPLYVLLLV